MKPGTTFSRAALCAAFAWSGLGASSALAADPFPSKPIRIIVPFGAGSSLDLIARIIAVPMAQQMKQGVIAENKTGAGGDIGTDAVAKAPKDGYTVVVTGIGNMVINPMIKKNFPYDPVKDLAPVLLIGVGPNGLFVTPEFKPQTLSEFIAFAKANPGKIRYGSAGVGTSNHMAGELFKYLTQTDIQHVPYKGTNEAMTDVMGGRIEALFSGLPPVLALVQSGRLRPIAMFDSKRAPALPNVPAVAEAGLPGAEAAAWYCVVAPAGTPPDVLERLRTEITTALQSADVRAQFAKLGIEPTPGTSAQLRDLIAKETTRWKKVVDSAHITAD